MEIEVEGEILTLLPEKAVYWNKEQILFLSDLHLGKAGHFRKHGIPVSRKVHLNDLQVLGKLIEQHCPKTVLLLGDLFHSFENNEWNDFLEFLNVFETTQFTLLEGNHDILNDYPKSLNVIQRIELGPFSFSHIKEQTDLYNISGHIHPGVTIRGRSRQSITMPCYHFSKSYGTLPAFGAFTGIKKIRPKKEDRVYGIVDRTVIELT